MDVTPHPPPGADKSSSAGETARVTREEKEPRVVRQAAARWNLRVTRRVSIAVLSIAATFEMPKGRALRFR